MTEDNQTQGWATAKTLAEALPYIQRYDRETVVIKYGGHAMGEEQVAKQFAADCVLLKGTTRAGDPNQHPPPFKCNCAVVSFSRGHSVITCLRRR